LSILTLAPELSATAPQYPILPLQDHQETVYWVRKTEGSGADLKLGGFVIEAKSVKPTPRQVIGVLAVKSVDPKTLKSRKLDRRKSNVITETV
jgi:hypothetical protein